MRRRVTAALSVLLCAVLLTACGDPNAFSGDEQLSASVKRSTEAALTYNYADGAHEPPTTYPTYTSGLSAFSLKAFRAMMETEQDSFVFSPASSFLQLSMLADAASSDTRQEILLALTGSLTADDCNACSSYFWSRLESVSRTGQKEEPDEQLTLDGALLIDRSVDVKSAFLQTEKNFFDYDVFRCDYADEHTAAKLAAYLKPYTDDSGITLNGAEALNTVSSVSVHDAWLEKSSAGDSAAYFTSNAKVLRSGKATGILKYTAKTPLKLLLIMPDSGNLDEYAAGFDATELTALLDSMNVTQQETAAIPSFSVESDKKARPLSDVLTKSGLYSLFTDKAGFTSLTYSNSAKLGEMYEIPPAFSVTADGINMGKAATAATSDSVQPDVTVDKPFIFMLLDNETNLPVLMGAYR